MALTPAQILLIKLFLDNAISTVFNEVAKMEPKEVEAGIIVEEARSKRLLEKLELH